MMNEWAAVALVVVGTIALAWIWRESNKPAPKTLLPYDERETLTQRNKQIAAIQKREEQ